MIAKIIFLSGVLTLIGISGLTTAEVKLPESAKAEISAKTKADERRLVEIVKIYNLTAEQQRQLQFLFEKRAAALEALKGNSSLDGKARALQSRAIYNRIDREFTALLTPAQKHLKKRLAEERASKAKAKN